jgi:hypothetical protein
MPRMASKCGTARAARASPRLPTPRRVSKVTRAGAVAAGRPASVP